MMKLLIMYNCLINLNLYFGLREDDKPFNINLLSTFQVRACTNSHKACSWTIHIAYIKVPVCVTKYQQKKN